MLQSRTGDTSHDEMILLGTQLGTNGGNSVRLDKMAISNFDDDQTRRNLLSLQSIDSEL